MRYTEIQQLMVHHHDTLNPTLWEDGKLKPPIKHKLLQIARHFIDFTNIPHFPLVDVTISGSNAAYSYNQYSDIDLHLIVNMPPRDPAMIELYNAKKTQYNLTYNIQIKGIHVELYVQDAKELHISAGVFSLLKNKWLSAPTHNVPEVSHKSVIKRVTHYNNKIRQAIRSSSLPIAQFVMDSIHRLRKAGLHRGGEFSPENLAFKQLRSMGKVGKLKSHIIALQSKELSLREKS